MAGRKSRQEKKIPMILKAAPLEGHRLDIEFGSGSLLKLNMENHVHTTRYYPLNDPFVFRSAITDGSKISFDTNSTLELEIFPREAVNMALRMPGENISILRIQPVENSHIRLEMETGSVMVLNMEKHVHTNRYSLLKDEELFRSVGADGEGLIFGNVFHGNILRIDEDELTRLMLSIPTAEGDENE